MIMQRTMIESKVRFYW